VTGITPSNRVGTVDDVIFARALTPEIAEAVTTRVLGERVRGAQPDTPEQERRLTLHRILSGVMACGCVAMGYWFGGGYSATIAFVWILAPTSFVWFSEIPYFRSRFSQRGPVSGMAIRWSGWFLLVIYFLYRVELVMFKP